MQVSSEAVVVRYPPAKVPWWAKMLTKMVVERIPNSYRLLSLLSITRHGEMDKPAYAMKVFKRHYNNVNPAPGFTGLELGPGDALSSAVIAKAFGARKFYLIDSIPVARTDMRPYVELLRYLREQGIPQPELEKAGSVTELLRLCNAEFLTEGLTSLKTIPAGSVDFVFSHSCLEHVRLQDVDDTLSEIARILTTNGAASHRVDLQDHVAHGLNNLRFEEKTWESKFFSESGFYTNRVRFSDFLERMRVSGLTSELTELYRWADVPTPVGDLDERYRTLPESELLVCGFSVVNRRPAETGTEYAEVDGMKVETPFI